MAEAKTKPTGVSVDDYLASRASPEQMDDCRALIGMLERLSGEPARMWGPSIVGFGSYRYALAGGKVGECCATGFAVRGRDLVVYIMGEEQAQAELLTRLGKHKMGKACLYFRRLSDLDQSVLEQLVVVSQQVGYPLHGWGVVE